MSPELFSFVLFAYFGMLLFISYLTSRKRDTATFFTANRNSPWYLVAVGMIGSSISGVTFISIPGEVGVSNFSYFQIVIGYLLGYAVIAFVLMPVYYRMNLVSIYQYLESRFGNHAYRTGTSFFFLSRVIGTSFRLFLVAEVLQIGIFDYLGVPFVITVSVTLLLIWLYTRKAGVKTIIWTDTVQTFFLISAVVASIVVISSKLNISFDNILTTISDDPHSQIFDWNPKSGSFFVKHFFAGAFIAIVMTGLDQEMMQKNLTCKTLRDAQKNMVSMSLSLIPVNLLFLSVGVLLYQYTQPLFDAVNHIPNLAPAEYAAYFTEHKDLFEQFASLRGKTRTDELFPTLALNNFGTFAGIAFILGITAAAFASADAALTGLTTAFAVDFLRVDIHDKSGRTVRMKNYIHVGFSVVTILVILMFHYLNDDSVVNAIFKAAGYTYGPLLGMYAFGLLTKLNTNDKAVPYIAIASPVICFFVNKFSAELLWGYKFGFEILILNGLLTFLGMLFFAKRKKNEALL